MPRYIGKEPIRQNNNESYPGIWNENDQYLFKKNNVWSGYYVKASENIIASGVSIPSGQNYQCFINSNGSGVIGWNSGFNSFLYFTSNGGLTWSTWTLPSAINAQNNRIIGSPSPNGSHWWLTDMDTYGGGRQVVYYASSAGGSWTKIYDVAVSREDQCYFLAGDNSGNATGLTGNNGNNGRGFNINSSGTASYVGSSVSSGGPSTIIWTGTSGEYVQSTQYRGLVSTTNSWTNYSTIDAISHPSTQFGRDSNLKNWICHITSGSGTAGKIYIRDNGVVTDISSSIGVVVTPNSYFNRYIVSTKNGYFYVYDRGSSSNNFKIYYGGSVIQTYTVPSGYIQHVSDQNKFVWIPTA